MKKVSLLGFILAATAVHFAPASAEGEVAVGVAQPGPGCPKAFQGFHLGGNIGYGIGWAKQKNSNELRTTQFDPNLSLRNGSTSNNLGVKGVDGGIGVGYTHRFCNWALGIEFDANWSGTQGKRTLSLGEFDDNVDRSVQTSSGQTKVRLRNSLELLARFGYVMREIAMPFVGFGWSNAQWKHTSSTNARLSNPEDPDQFQNVTRSASKSKRLNGFLWKAGVDFLATKHVVVGLEYTGSVFGKVKFRKTNSLPYGLTGNEVGSAKPQYNKFALTAKIVY